MTLIILFLVFFGVFVLVRLSEQRAARLDSELIDAMARMSSSLKEGDSIETSIKEISEGKDLASQHFKKVLGRMKKGKTLSQSFESFRIRSAVYSYLTAMVKAYDDTEADISQELHEGSKNLTALSNMEKGLRAEVDGPIMILQIICIVGAPVLILFVSGLLETPLFEYSFYFMGIMAVMYAFFDYLVYSDLKHTLFILPVFITAYLLAVQEIAPYLLQFFM